MCIRSVPYFRPQFRSVLFRSAPFRKIVPAVGDALEKHHNTSRDCAIITLNSSLYLGYFAHLIKQHFARRLSYTCTMIYVGFTVI